CKGGNPAMRKLKSRKLWTATITTLVLWVSAVAGLDLDLEQILGIASPIIAYILGESWVDARK
ncbi:MAG: hypothetical protein ACE5IA_02365, partial [Dehalococcoidia bacterium]